MEYDFKYDNDVRIKIWENTIPIRNCSNITTITKEYKHIIKRSESRTIAVEIRLPKNKSNYGLICVKYNCDNIGSRIKINVSNYYDKEYNNNIAIIPDVVYVGIPKDYACGIIKSIDDNSNMLLRCGTYEFYCGAHGVVGSSEVVFYNLAFIVLKLLLEYNINIYTVKKIIDEIYN